AHSNIGGVALSGISNRQSVVATGWNLEFQASDEVTVLIVSVQDPAFFRFATNRSIGDFVVLDGTFPTVQGLPIKQRHKSVVRKDVIGFHRWDFTNKDVLPANFTPVRLKLNRAPGN